MKLTARLLWRSACLLQHNSGSLRCGTICKPQKARHTFSPGRLCVTMLWTSKNAYDSSEPLLHLVQMLTHTDSAELAAEPSSDEKLGVRGSAAGESSVSTWQSALEGPLTCSMVPSASP